MFKVVGICLLLCVELYAQEREHSVGKFAVLPQKESYDWFSKLAKEKAPTWENRVTIESFYQAYNPNFYVPLISQTPLLMIIASNDIPAPTQEAKKTFELAKTVKSKVIRFAHLTLAPNPATSYAPTLGASQ